MVTLKLTFLFIAISRNVERKRIFYIHDAIFAVGFKVNSQWAIVPLMEISTFRGFSV